MINSKDSTKLIAEFTVPALAVVGKSDSVGVPSEIETITFPGGHFSSQEAMAETKAVIQRVIELSEWSCLQEPVIGAA